MKSNTSHNISVFDESPEQIFCHFQGIALSKLLAAQGKTSDALEILDPIALDLESKQLYGMLIEVLVLQALLLATQGNTKKIMAVLEKALRLRVSQSYHRIFLDEGRTLEKLLYRLVHRRDQELKTFAHRLLDAFQEERNESHAAEGRTMNLSDSLEPLGKRELQVLRLIAAGKSYKEIAQTLIIAVGTVQYYIKSLYAKLQVHSGLEAVARAREIGLLP